MGSSRAFALILIAISFITTTLLLNTIYTQRIEQINAVGRTNIEEAVVWQFGNSILNSGIIDDIANFTVDTQYLGSYPFGTGRQNYIAFRDKILADYQGLINASTLINASVAIFIDNKLIYINGGTVSYNGRNAPYEIVAVYDPIIFFWFVIPNYDLYAVYNLSNAKFYDENYGYIINATKLPLTPATLQHGYCIYVEGTKANGTICYDFKLDLPYIVKTPNYWGGYNLTIYWGEKR